MYQDQRAPMFHATCTDCGNDCQVPFKPSHGRPVLCKNCFQNGNGENRGERSFDRPPQRNFDRPQRSFDRPQRSFDRPSRPAFGGGFRGNDRDDRGPRNDSSKQIQQLSEQLNLVNGKLNTILKLLGNTPKESRDDGSDLNIEGLE